ncbi:uncharacterized protein LOC129927635 isoform X2 [Biomphalaria glabrata]|uniref:Uncharacterized protein LOC129927635 isoform X2 n=1 Tax=Biomphalaria glabrata TaxID=6526 RepID=A0A9W3B1R1_BIOGL|nr:uncharacterized protein LOC129927635 isoform X2 [Biomphalaria glabrata]
MKNVMNQERPSVKTKEVITVNTSLDLDTFSKLLPFLRCYFVNSPVNEENKLNVEDQASWQSNQNLTKTTPKPSNADRMLGHMTTITKTPNKTRLNETTDPTYSSDANAPNKTRLKETTDPTYSSDVNAPNKTRLKETTDPTYSSDANAPNKTRLKETTDPTYSSDVNGSMEEKVTMVISIFSTIFIAVALVCTGIVIYIWKRVFNFSSGSSPAVQFNIQSNAAEEIEIAEENHVYDSIIYTGYQTFQPTTSEDLTEPINSNATSISDLSIQPETSESLTESIPTSIADQTPKTTEGLTITINGTSTRIADQTETDPVYVNMACQTIQPKSSECLIESIYKIPTNNAVRIFQPKPSESQTATISLTSTCVADQTLNDSKCPTETDPVYINMACQTE